MEMGPDNELFASVGITVLTRMDFLTLGHQRDVEATVRCSKDKKKLPFNPCSIVK